ncbi:hypothetical protein NUSPORA_02402 [Nucleospora cyclopteri]
MLLLFFLTIYNAALIQYAQRNKMKFIPNCRIVNNVLLCNTNFLFFHTGGIFNRLNIIYKIIDNADCFTQCIIKEDSNPDFASLQMNSKNLTWLMLLFFTLPRKFVYTEIFLKSQIPGLLGVTNIEFNKVFPIKNFKRTELCDFIESENIINIDLFDLMGLCIKKNTFKPYSEYSMHSFMLCFENNLGTKKLCTLPILVKGYYKWSSYQVYTPTGQLIYEPHEKCIPNNLRELTEEDVELPFKYDEKEDIEIPLDKTKFTQSEYIDLKIIEWNKLQKKWIKDLIITSKKRIEMEKEKVEMEKEKAKEQIAVEAEEEEGYSSEESEESSKYEEEIDEEDIYEEEIYEQEIYEQEIYEDEIKDEGIDEQETESVELEDEKKFVQEEIVSFPYILIYLSALCVILGLLIFLSTFYIQIKK